MKITSVVLHQIAGSPDSFCYDLPQFVFAGKSNVGKSSLLRTLVNNKKLVRVGQKPGVTRSINFFKVNEECYFVDVPGYGYAKTSKTAQEQWKYLLNQYFREAINIRKVLFLLDVRRELSEKDMTFFDMIVNYHLPYMIVITKSDKVSRNDAKKKQLEISRKLMLKPEECILFSALNRQGKEEILKAISATL
ncbi:MAG: YihA family ribosome biogenesis GTP-binding protein [bacterium]|nr:YihA family ribosome biogenesis GTP-binding protein [bacterium]